MGQLTLASSPPSASITNGPSGFVDTAFSFVVPNCATFSAATWRVKGTISPGQLSQRNIIVGGNGVILNSGSSPISGAYDQSVAMTAAQLAYLFNHVGQTIQVTLEDFNQVTPWTDAVSLFTIVLTGSGGDCDGPGGTPGGGGGKPSSAKSPIRDNPTPDKPGINFLYSSVIKGKEMPPPSKARDIFKDLKMKGDEEKEKPKEEKKPGVPDELIISRCKVGKAFMGAFSSVDKASCQNFRDPTGTDIYIDYERYMDEDANVLDDQPIGVTNQFQINVLTLSAALCINDPDFTVRADTPSSVDLVRKDIRRQWKTKNWTRKARTSVQKMCIGGLGCLAYRWDKDKRTVFEPVHTWDMIVFPGVTDWWDLEWGGRIILMSLRQAIERYPDAAKKGAFKDKQPADEKDPTASADRLRIAITLYWDKQTEAVLYNNKVIKRSDNKYKEVPLIFIEGDIDPGPTAFPLGNGVLTSGQQQQITDLDAMITNTAKNGGPINVIQETALSKTLQEAWTDGREQGLLPVKIAPDKAIHRIPAEEISQTALAARQEAKKSLHAIMGTNDSMMGQHMEGVTKATEAAMISQNSGSRQVQGRRAVENLLDRMAWRVILCERAFGGAKMEGGKVRVKSEERELWLAYQEVREVTTVEASSVYRDPNQDQQQCMQLKANTAKILPLLLQLGMPAPMGLALMLKLTMDELRAFGRSNLDEYMPGAQQFMALLAESYVPGLVQGQLPPPPQGDKGKPLSTSVSAAFDKLPDASKLRFLVHSGLLDPSEAQALAEHGGLSHPQDQQGHQQPQPETGTEQAKAEEGERSRIAEMARQAAQHDHELRMLARKQEHEAQMKGLDLPPLSVNGNR